MEKKQTNLISDQREYKTMWGDSFPTSIGALSPPSTVSHLSLSEDSENISSRWTSASAWRKSLETGADI